MEDVYLLVYIADKNLTNVGLDIGPNSGDNDPTRHGRAQAPTAPFNVKH